MTFFFYACLVLFILVCLILIGLILIQKGRGGGLASAFGGAGGNTAFGSKTGDVLTWATSIIFGIFIVLAVVLNLLSNKMDKVYRANVAASSTIILPTPTLPAGLPGLGLPSAAPAAPAAPEATTPPAAGVQTPVETPDAAAVPAPAPSPAPVPAPAPSTTPAGASK